MCPLTVFSVRCPFYRGVRLPYREFSYSKMTDKRPGPTQSVCLKEVSVL